MASRVEPRVTLVPMYKLCIGAGVFVFLHSQNQKERHNHEYSKHDFNAAKALV